MHFLTGASILIVDFEHLSDGWECYVCILTIAIQVTINGKPDQDAFVFTVAFRSISKRTANQFREFLRKIYCKRSL